jgi:hypothetical protein
MTFRRRILFVIGAILVARATLLDRDGPGLAASGGGEP